MGVTTCRVGMDIGMAGGWTTLRTRTLQGRGDGVKGLVRGLGDGDVHPSSSSLGLRGHTQTGRGENEGDGMAQKGGIFIVQRDCIRSRPVLFPLVSCFVLVQVASAAAPPSSIDSLTRGSVPVCFWRAGGRLGRDIHDAQDKAAFCAFVPPSRVHPPTCLQGEGYLLGRWERYMLRNWARVECA